MKKNGEIRRENLLIAIDKLGSATLLASAAEISAAYISQIKTASPESKTGKPKTMGDAVARRIEKALGVPEGWMDVERTGFSFEQKTKVVHSWPFTASYESFDQLPEYEKIRIDRQVSHMISEWRELNQSKRSA